jgi:hypothetical protein
MAYPPRPMSGPKRTWRRTGLKALLSAAVALVLSQTPGTAHAALAADAWLPVAPTAVSGWKADFVDNFSGSLNTRTWGRYQGGVPAGTVSTYASGNVGVNTGLQANDGVLQVTTQKIGGTWTGAGISSSPGFAATQGKWVIKAKFDRAYGVGYAFLLMPKGGGWPPELDIIEGTMGGPHIMSTYHYGTASNHQQIQRWLRGVDMTKWHTYGVIITSGRIGYTIDGREWASVNTSAAPTVPMWLGIQTGVKNCAQSTGECLSASTPTSAKISVDWVAHYRKV